MPTYVTSPLTNARHAHLNFPPLCGALFGPDALTGPNLPADRTLCPRCAERAVRYRILTPADLACLDRPADVRDLTEEILTLLGEGSTDDQVALRLGLSTRSVGRRVSKEMSRLSVLTRYQLGYAIAIRDAAREARGRQGA